MATCCEYQMLVDVQHLHLLALLSDRSKWFSALSLMQQRRQEKLHSFLCNTQLRSSPLLLLRSIALAVPTFLDIYLFIYLCSRLTGKCL